MKALVFGYGSIGKRHARILQEKMGASLTVVSSLVVDDPQISYRRNLADVEDIAEFDYYIIASETHKHLEQLIFLNSRVSAKKILVEKPLFAKCPGADFALANQDNQIFVGYNLRFHPLLVLLEERLRNEHILHANFLTGYYLPWWRPEVDYRCSYSADSRKGGGVLSDLSHELDLAAWMLGDLDRINSISAKISRLEIDSDDYFSLLGKTERNVTVSITLDYISKSYLRQFVIHSEERTYFADLAKGELRVSGKDQQEQIVFYQDVPRDESFAAMHRAILENESHQACGFQDGLKIVRLIDRARDGGKGANGKD